MKTDKDTATGEPTEEEKAIQRLKAQYGKVYQLRVTDDEGNLLLGYLKKPSIEILSASISVGQSDPLRGTRIILESCWLEGNERILKEDDLLISALSAVEAIVQFRKAELVKL